MNDLGLVSVIIPVYDVERYLPQCLESVCGQSYANLEIIVVDDESPDRCGEIADEYAERDRRIKVFHIKNRGAAGARNMALDVCTGDYVMFVDSDDWLELNAVEQMMTVLRREECDIIQCQFIDEFKDHSKYRTYIEKNSICNDFEFAKTMITKWEYIINCNKIYRYDILEEVRFVEGRCIDDEFFTYRAILKANKIALITDHLYHYRRRESSAMGSFQKEKQRLMDRVDYITQRYKPLSQAYPRLKIYLLEDMMELLMMVMSDSARYPQIYTYAKKKLYQYGIKGLFIRTISRNTKKSVLFYLVKKRTHFIDKKGQIEFEQHNYFD